MSTPQREPEIKIDFDSLPKDTLLLSDYGFGKFQKIEDNIVELDLGWAKCFCHRSTLKQSITLQLRTFWPKATKSEFSLDASPNDKISSIIDKASKEIGVPAADLRLVCQGKELKAGAKDADTTTVASAQLSPPYHILCIVDRQSAFVLDMQYCGGDISLSADGSTATICTDCNRCYMVRANRAFTKGKHFWKVRIERCDASNIFIGVCAESARLDWYLGQGSDSWGYHSSGNIYHRGGSRPYGEGMRPGDVVTVTLDMEARAVSFARNGKNFPTAFTSLPSKVYPALSLFGKHDCVKLIEFGTL